MATMHPEFGYKDYSEETLLKLCDPNEAKMGLARWIYWTAEVYSFGKHIRNYAYYPSFLPLYCFTDHGAGAPSYGELLPFGLECTLKNNAKEQFDL